MAKSLRAFIAVPLPPALIQWLRDMVAQLRTKTMDVRWVKADNVHLTVRFLGDIDPVQVAAIADAMDAAVASRAPTQLHASGVGVFPSYQRARVLWAGLAGDLEGLHGLQTAVEAALEKIGFARERRRFHAHLTIGRVRRPIAAETLTALLAPFARAASDPFHMDRVVLYQSILKPAGAVYTPLHTVALTAGPTAADE